MSAQGTPVQTGVNATKQEINVVIAVITRQQALLIDAKTGTRTGIRSMKHSLVLQSPVH